MKIRSLWLPLAILAICAGSLFALQWFWKRQKQLAPLNKSAAAVVTTTPANALISGTISAQNVVHVGEGLKGNIESFAVEVGEDVFQGQVLARVGAGDVETERQNMQQDLERLRDAVSKAETAVNAAQMELSRAEADASRSRQELERVRKVADLQSTRYKSKATPRLVYEKAMADLEAAIKDSDVMDAAVRTARDSMRTAETRLNEAKGKVTEKEAQIADAEEQYQNTEVHSPVDGMVVARKGEPGKPVEEAGNDLFIIATDIYALQVTVEPKEEVRKRVYPGQPATVFVLDLQSSGMPGEVSAINGNQVVVHFNSTTPTIKPGMRAEVRFKME